MAAHRFNSHGPHSTMTAYEFNTGALVYAMIQHEDMLAPAKSALRVVGSQMHLHSMTSDGKLVTFRVVHRTIDDPCDTSYLTLRVIKGSLHTLIWSTFARFDDEYALYYHLEEQDFLGDPDKVFLVWSMKGVDAVNSKISVGMIDWFLLRRIQASLKVNGVGVLAFTKLLGRFLISVPNFLQMQLYMPPMPATFMFNYLMVVSYCPFELSVSKLPRFCSQGIDHTSGITNRGLLQAFIQPNGSGAWINGYLPVRLASGGYVLQSKYYFEPGDALLTSYAGPTVPAAEATVLPGGACWFGDHPNLAHPQEATDPTQADLHTISMDVADDRPPPQPQPPPQTAPCSGLASLTFSMQCDLLLQETAVRVVELLHHPLGVRGIIVVLEFVHNRMWTANSRFVALDSYKVCQAIHAAGQLPSLALSKVEILDQQGWARLTGTSHAHMFGSTFMYPDTAQQASTTAEHTAGGVSASNPLSAVSRDSYDGDPVDGNDGNDDHHTSESGEDAVAMGLHTASPPHASAVLLKSSMTAYTVLSPTAGALHAAPPRKSQMKNVNFVSKAGRYNYINFENTCEWGAPNIIKRPADFYPMLIEELQK